MCISPAAIFCIYELFCERDSAGTLDGILQQCQPDANMDFLARIIATSWPQRPLVHVDARLPRSAALS